MTTIMDVASNNVFLSYNVTASSDLGKVSQLVAMYKPSFIFLQKVTLDSDSLVMVPGLHGCIGASNVDHLGVVKPDTATPVSYTHLTLPTICSV